MASRGRHDVSVQLELVQTNSTHTHREKHQSYISQLFWGGNPRQWTPLTQASISESVPMRLRHHIPGVLVYEETRTRTMTTKTHCFHLYVDVMAYTCLSHHQPFVREISPLITLKRIRYAGLYCFRFISLNNFYISEVPMIWFAVTLMWCPYYDKGVVNFDVTVLLISYTKILCVKRGYFKKPWSHYDVRHTIYRRIQLNLTCALLSLVAPELSLW